MSGVLFSGGNIFAPTGEMLSDHGLLVDKGRIVRIAPLAEFEGYGGQRVDTSGASLLPGLIDCHVHLCLGGEADPGTAAEKLKPGQLTMRALQHAQATLRGGITSIRDCGGKEFLEFAVRDACNSGVQLGPTIMASGRIICMTGGHGNRWGRIADGVDEVVKAVREQIHAGSDLVKIMATGGVMTPGVNPEDAHYTEEEMAAGIGEAHRFHRHCASHAQGEQGILNAVRGGIDSIEHGFCLTETCIALMLERGTFVVPTLAALWNIVSNDNRGIPAYALEKARKWAETQKQSIKAYYAAGGKIAMGTDAGTPFNRHGENAQELKYMVETIGISPKDALLIGTRNGSELMRMVDRGRLEEGCTADLLLVEGDPLADINCAAEQSNHLLVMKNGRVALDRRTGGEALRQAAE